MKNSEIAPIVLKIKEGDLAAFDELYRAMWETVYYIALKLLDSPQDAQDAAQESFIQIHQDIHKLEHVNAFNSWMNRIVFNTCMRISKKQGKLELDSFDDAEVQLIEDNPDFLPEETLANKELCKEISQIVSELPSEQKAAVLLYYFEQMSVDTVAETLETTPNAIALKLYKARNTMKSKIEKLKNKGITLHSVAALPVLSRILISEAAEVCTPEIGEKIWKGIETAIALTAGAAGAAATAASAAPASTATTSMTVSAKIAIGVASVCIIAGGVLAYVSLTGNEPAAPSVKSRTTQSVAAEIPSETESEAVIVSETRIRVIEDMIGDFDADVLRSWTVLTPSEENEKFNAFINKHEIKLQSVFYDIDVEQPGKYSFYTLAKQDKNLLIVQYQSTQTSDFCVAYSFENIGDTVLENRYIKQWFNENAES